MDAAHLVIRTRRIELRPLSIDDSQALFEAYASDPQVTRYLPWRPAQSAAETAAHLAVRLSAAAAGESYSWVIRMLDENPPTGMIELRLTGEEANVGYVLARSHWGRGIMPEALTAVVQFARERLALIRIWGTCDAENRASARVFEKCGFRRIGRLEAVALHPTVSDELRDAEHFELPLRP